MNLQDKVAVVTGASRGIGRETSKVLVEKGAHVFGFSRTAADLEDTLAALGSHFHPVPCDVRQIESVREAFAQVHEQVGRIDVLVNNAGLGRNGPVDQLSPEDWQVQLETNLSGIFLCTREVVPIMKRQNASSGFGGHIINIASIAGLIGNAGLSAYNATKFGVRGMSEALMKELRNDGIKVSCVYPGSVQTGFFTDAGIEPSPHMMQPEDIAGTILHLLEAPDHYLISEVVMRPLRPRSS